MRRLPIPILLFLIAIPAVAQVRSRAAMPVPLDLSGSTVSGIISSVSGPFILLADGLVIIDTTGAKMAGDPPTPGSPLFAALDASQVAPNAPLRATYVAVTRLAQVTLTGTVTMINDGERTLTVLGRTIKVTPQTAISGLITKATTLADIVVNQSVQVEADNFGGTLVASRIRVLSIKPVPSPLPTVIRGTVRSISSTLWVIAAEGKDWMITVNAQTKIVGAPKVGDTVDVLITADNVALSIVNEPQLRITGFVKSIAATQWTVGLGPAGSFAPDFLVEVNASTKIIGDPKVGDRVEVVGTIGKSSFVASSITRTP
ncbi:MAG: DUF5666 domain-containing protein [Acidobacteriota bacterium]